MQAVLCKRSSPATNAIRLLGVLGSALAALLALAGPAAPIASAANGTLTTTTGGSVHVSATQAGPNLFRFTDHLIAGIPAQKTCTTVLFTSAGPPVANGASTIVVHPTYEGCTAFGLKSTISTTGCDYVIHTGETIGATGSFDGTVDVSCAAGSAITVTAVTCELKVDPQAGIKTVIATNAGSASEMDLLLHVEFTGVTYTVTKDGIGCPLSGTGSFTNGDFTGSITATATDPNSGAPAGITLHD